MATQVAIENLNTWLSNQQENTVSTPFKLEVTGLTVENFHLLNTYTSSQTNKYVDLSETSLPSGISSLSGVFPHNDNLVYAPAIPNEEINCENSFTGCINLKEAYLPKKATNCSYAFADCTSLLKANLPLKDSNNNISGIFENCTSITQLDVINFHNADAITVYTDAFKYCTYFQSFKCNLPYELKLWFNQLSEEGELYFNPNASNYAFLSTEDVQVIPIETLSNNLLIVPVNVYATMYKINVTGITVENYWDLHTAIQRNMQKIVDLSYTELPNGITSLRNFFAECENLIKSPKLPNTVTDLYCTYYNSMLNEPPILPNSVIDMTQTFANTRIQEAPNLPNSVQRLSYTFYNTNIHTSPIIPNSVIYMNGTFNKTLLTSIPIIPNSVVNMEYAFYDVKWITETPIIPNSVENIKGAFSGCIRLEKVVNVPDSITDITGCFSGCTSLEEIDNFEADIDTLVTNNMALDCFKNCTSLTKILTSNGTPAIAQDWHIYRLNFDSNSVSGKVFDKDGTTHTIAQTSITKSDITFPILTDELWFPTGYTDVEIEAIIQKMITYKYGVFNKDTIPPDKKSFVLQAQDPTQLITNLPFVKTSDIVNSVTSGNMHSVTSNAVASALNGGTWENVEGINYKRIGKMIFLVINQEVIYFTSSGGYAKSVSTGNDIVIPERYRPSMEINTVMIWNSEDVVFRLRLTTEGKLQSWNLGSLKTLPTGSDKTSWQTAITYCL